MICGKLTLTRGFVNFFSRPTAHTSKLSQKQRKLIAMAAKDSSPEIVPDVAMQPSPLQAKKPGNVWYVLPLIWLFMLTLNIRHCF